MVFIVVVKNICIQSYLFQGLSESFYRQVSILVRHVYVLAADVILHENEIDDNLYFVHRGVVMFYKESEAHSYEKKKLLASHQCFGEVIFSPF